MSTMYQSQASRQAQHSVFTPNTAELENNGNTTPFQGISQLSVEQTKQVSGGDPTGKTGEIQVED